MNSASDTSPPDRPTLVTRNPGTLVAVAAHADDAELNAGGLMAKWVAAGGNVVIVMLTNNHSGELIPTDGDPAELVRLGPAQTTRIRHAEQDAAAALIGAETRYLDYPQRHFWDGSQVVSLDFRYDHAPGTETNLPPLVVAFRQETHVRRLADLLVSLDPHLVLTQPPIDLDVEHHAAAGMVYQAFLLRRAELRRASLRFWTPGSSCMNGLIDPHYEHVEDITPYFQAKMQLCACHRSQMTPLRYDMVESRAALWGGRIGVEYAEPFKDALLPK